MERNYNYRKRMKEKEQKRRKFLYSNVGYFPTMPNQKTDMNSNEYYTEGDLDLRKGYLKRESNKKVRRHRLSHGDSGSNYKKVFNLMYEWY